MSTVAGRAAAARCAGRSPTPPPSPGATSTATSASRPCCCSRPPAGHVRAAVHLRVRRRHPGPGVDNYVDYLMAGILAQTVIFGSTQTGVGLAEDVSSMIDQFSPTRSPLGRARRPHPVDTVASLFVVILMLVVGTLVEFRFHAESVPAIGAVALAWPSGSPSPGSRPSSACRSATSSRPRRPGSSGCSWSSPPRRSSRWRACPAGCSRSPGSTRSPSPSARCRP